MWGPRRSRGQVPISAPSRRTWPELGSQTPTTRRASVLLPAALGPISPSDSPGSSAKDRPRRIGRSLARRPNTSRSTEIAPRGAGSSRPSTAAGVAASSFDSRSQAPRSSTRVRQLPTSSSTGASARPRMIEEAIMIPGLACWSTTR